MGEHDPGLYGKHIAGAYDEITTKLGDTTDATVVTVADLAEGGPVLEFGIGTGRLALPLIERGVEVTGIDGSPDMVERLRAKPGGTDIAVTIGDFADVRVPGEFSLVLLAYNTIYALPSQEAQVRCFANAAAHLRPGGRFVLDAWIPDPGAFRNGYSLRTLSVDDTEILIEAARIDPLTQRMTTTKAQLGPGGVQLFPANHRYAWPAELDLMAQLAGMKLEHRWGTWNRDPLTTTDHHHISVYKR